MRIDEVIEQTKKYIAEDITEHNKSLAVMLLKELNKAEEDDNYIIPSSVMRSIVDSFDFSTEYWKNCFSKYWNENLSKFKNPYE